ncbi:MAG: ABC transporter permease subunit [Cyanobacteria bacterium P01_H01_bin.15]
MKSIPPWRNRRLWIWGIQVVVLLVVIGLLGYFARNLTNNYAQLGLRFGFNFLQRPAGFAIGDTPIPFERGDSFLWAVCIGVVNTLRVSVLGIVLATLLGTVAGVARLADNWLVRQLAAVYVQVFRNTPLLLQLFFWYGAVFLQLPPPIKATPWGDVWLTNRGLSLPMPAAPGWEWGVSIVTVGLLVVVWRSQIPRRRLWGLSTGLLAVLLIWRWDWQVPQFDEAQEILSGGLQFSPEFATLLFGLTLYTGAFIAEVVRGGIQSVTAGQREAAIALGLSESLALRLIVFPQALRVILPSLTNEYLNLTKNSSLAIAFGFSDLYAIAFTIQNNTGRAVEMLLLIMALYLLFDLGIVTVMNAINRQLLFPGGRG